MAVYAIGDLQGCYDPFRHLLDEIDFDPAKVFRPLMIEFLIQFPSPMLLFAALVRRIENRQRGHPLGVIHRAAPVDHAAQ